VPRQYRVQWSASASHDLRAVINYISADSLEQASRQLGEIKTRARNLERFPERGRLVPELKEQGISLYRELIVGPWRLIYRIAEKDVYVLCFLDARRNVEDILLDRFVRD